MKQLFIVSIVFVLNLSCLSQSSDSTLMIEKTNYLISVCQKIDFSDSNILKLGTYYKAAEVILYAGEDEKRKFKSTVNYSDKEEKQYVDQLCKHLTKILGTNKEWKLADQTIENDGKIMIYTQKFLYRDSVYESFSELKFKYIKIKGALFLMELI